ncbi:HEAT repeat domain-containing protein [Maricaulis salignorans]|uniref:HEAT repeat domain-containing protein n=1 Tax=Maricaulis salignorans TaxID=144026 RepID=UPI003A904098
MLSLIAAAYLQLANADAPALLHWAEECVKHVDDLSDFAEPLPSLVASEPEPEALVASYSFQGCMNDLAALGWDGEAAAAAIRPLLDHPDLLARTAALRVLGHFGDTESLPEVREHLDSGDWFETLAAIDAIALLGGAEDVARLSELAASHWLPGVRARAWAAASRFRYNPSPDSERGSVPLDNPSQDERLERRLPELGFYRLPTPRWDVCPSEAFRFRDRVISRQAAATRPAYGEPASLEVLNGEFLYTDEGEFGGELVWREGGVDQRLIADNIKALIPLGDRTFLAVTGLAHLSIDEGTLYRVSSGGTGWDVTEISSLTGVPHWAAPMSDGLIGVRTSVGFIVASQDEIVGMGQCEPGPLAMPLR